MAAVIVFTTATARAEHPALLSVAEANQVASTHADQVKRCYFRHAIVDRTAIGEVRIDVQVKSDGGVAAARVFGPGTAGRAFSRCVIGRALTWRFPASRAATEVRMPFRFHVPVRFRTRGARR